MSTLLLDVKFDGFSKYDVFAEALPEHTVIDWNSTPPDNLSDIQYMLCWQHDRGLPARLPDLKALFSAGAGVDHVISDPDLPSVPLVRFVDPTLTNRMSEWIVLQVLMHQRQQRDYDQLQRNKNWQELSQPEACQLTVGIMGYGVLGQDAGNKLRALGYNVQGWSKSSKSIENVATYSENQLDDFLSGTDILVGLLPHTPETHGIFNSALFRKLSRKGPFGAPIFINAGRGKSQTEADIAECLQDGTLKGVSLDVFEKEPLASQSPLWDFDQAILTPHVAATSDVRALAAHVARQIERMEAGLPAEHLVDHQKGY